MNQEERDTFRILYKKFEEAEKACRDYIEQFFTRIWEGKIVKESSKILTRDNLGEIQKLRKKSDQARENLKYRIVGN